MPSSGPPAAVASPRRDRRVALTIGAAVTCGVGLVGIGLAAFSLTAGHDRDVATLHGFAGLYRSWLDREIEVTARIADPLPYALVGLACIGVALARRRVPRAIAVGAILLGTGVSDQILKHVLAQERYAWWLGFRQVDAASWPSGHSTAALTLALCAVLVAPPAWRVAVGLVGGAATVALAYATLALAWHYPSDVLAGYLLAGLWVFVAILVLQRIEVADPEPARPPGFAALIALAAVVAAVATVVAADATNRVFLSADERSTAIVGAFAIAAMPMAVIIATVIAASGPFARGLSDVSLPRAPAPSAAAEGDKPLWATRGRAAPGGSPPRRSPARESARRAP
jgi:membrane-associated phospholipid phosphatase